MGRWTWSGAIAFGAATLTSVSSAGAATAARTDPRAETAGFETAASPDRRIRMFSASEEAPLFAAGEASLHGLAVHGCGGLEMQAGRASAFGVEYEYFDRGDPRVAAASNDAQAAHALQLVWRRRF